MAIQKNDQLSKKILLLSFLVLILGSLIHYRFGYYYFDQSGHAWGPDDAFISYRYAQNLSSGNGLVFNPGEYVEGYSNLLLVLLASLFLLCGINYPNLYFAITVFNLLVAITFVYVFYLLLNKSLGQKKATIGALILCLSPLLWIWVSAGMEVPMVLLFQLLIWVSVDRLVEQKKTIDSRIWIAATLFLCFTRADGFIFPIISLTYLALKRQYRTSGYLLIGLIIIMGTLTLWRYTYYGQLFPNTYYAKVSGPFSERILIATGLLAYLAVNQGFFGYFASLALSTYTLIRMKLTAHLPIFQNLRFDIFASLAWLAYWFYIGGATYLERFLIILIPLSIYTTLSILRTTSRRGCIVLIVAFIVIQSSIFFLDPRFQYTTNKFDRWVTLGHYLREHHPDQIIAADAVGKIAFFSGLYTIDMLGLNDPYIARTDPTFFSPGHNKYDPDYIFARQPDLISAWIANCPKKDCNWLDLSYGLTEDKYLQAGYALAYLIYSGKIPPQEWILDVRSFGGQVKLDLIDKGYKYAILRKTVIN